eukprot:gene752-1436_t
MRPTRFKTKAPDPRPSNVNNSGHKAFNAGESQAYSDCLRKEKAIMLRFEKEKYNMHRPRDPILGGHTPRMGSEGPLLMVPPESSAQILTAKIIESRKVPDVTAKIGLIEHKSGFGKNDPMADEFLIAIRKRRNVVTDALNILENEYRIRQEDLDRSYEKIYEKKEANKLTSRRFLLLSTMYDDGNSSVDLDQLPLNQTPLSNKNEADLIFANDINGIQKALGYQCLSSEWIKHHTLSHIYDQDERIRRLYETSSQLQPILICKMECWLKSRKSFAEVMIKINSASGEPHSAPIFLINRTQSHHGSPYCQRMGVPYYFKG